MHCIESLIASAELKRIAKALKLDADSVLGKLMRLVVWYRDQDDAVQASAIDSTVVHAGFAQALVGFLFIVNDAGMMVPCGLLGDEVKRMRNARRMRSHRKKTIAMDAHVRAHVQHMCSTRDEAAEAEGRVRTSDLPQEVPEQGLEVEVEAQKHEEKEKQSEARAANLTEDEKAVTLQKVLMPDWMPLDSWKEFVRMRAKARRPLTEHAKELCVRRLGRMRAAGQDPRVVLEETITNGWLGIFEDRNYFPGRRVDIVRPRVTTEGVDYQKDATPHEDIRWAGDKDC